MLYISQSFASNLNNGYIHPLLESSTHSSNELDLMKLFLKIAFVLFGNHLCLVHPFIIELSISFIKLKYYIGGPCNPGIIFGMCILNYTDKFILNNENLKLICCIKKENYIILYGYLEYIFNIVIEYYKKISQHHNIEYINISGFLGSAGWDRTQLLGEVSKKHWGLCKVNISDLLDIENISWENIYNSNRIIFADSSEFSEEF